MKWNFINNEPIYNQIVEIIITKIILTPSGNGRYDMDTINKLKGEIVKEEMMKLYKRMTSLGISVSQIIDLINEVREV